MTTNEETEVRQAITALEAALAAVNKVEEAFNDSEDVSWAEAAMSIEAVLAHLRSLEADLKWAPFDRTGNPSSNPQAGRRTVSTVRPRWPQQSR